MTINAPSFESAILWHAKIIWSISMGFWKLRFQNKNFFRFFLMKPGVPNANKNFLISGWKITINAINPTLIKAPKISLKRSISKAFTILHIRNIATIPKKILMATVPFRRLYNTYKRAATSRRSIISRRRMPINPVINNSIKILLICFIIKFSNYSVYNICKFSIINHIH